ncbi:hypothetical protein RP20_CCG011772 [Aedes albopictus]|nr:hypothetical protein RP20_CCG011772 [Aedes albopictus]
MDRALIRDEIYVGVPVSCTTKFNGLEVSVQVYYRTTLPPGSEKCPGPQPSA